MRKSFRVKTEKDFQTVFEQHNSVANKMFIVYTMKKEKQKNFRLGISVSKKVSLRAHERVWIKRRIRQSVLELKPQLKNNVDILIIARPISFGQSMNIIKENLVHVFKLADLFEKSVYKPDIKINNGENNEN